MNERHYYVNRKDRSHIEGPFYVGRQAVLQDGTVLTNNLRGAIPVEEDIYLAELGGDPLPGCPEPAQVGISAYYQRNISRSLVGEILDPLARVRETVTCTPVPINDLRLLKRQELKEHAQSVFFSSFEMKGAGGAKFWVNANMMSREYRSAADRYYMWQPPSGEDLKLETTSEPPVEVRAKSTQPAWRPIPVWLRRQDNNKEVKVKLTKDQWADELKEAEGRFGVDVALSADAVEDEIDALHALGDWTGLAILDVKADPEGAPWPPHSLGAFNGEAF